ncbi:hypothetical protein ABW20_dc0103459 [Dactylellina cionopaga]|nr:hypothetical protein ABW20_dc0103459 [Dactylellina cionopaga]
MANIKETMSRVKFITGRMEFISEGQDFAAVVDYAHNTGGLQKVLSTIREFHSGRLICVFGCSGGRDPIKRPQMGAVVAALADIAIITSSNPREEDPSSIVEDVKAGTVGFDVIVKVEVDRRKAIEYAMGIAQSGDFILFAGKGHETYQVRKGGPVPYNEREVVREALRKRQTARSD